MGNLSYTECDTLLIFHSIPCKVFWLKLTLVGTACSISVRAQFFTCNAYYRNFKRIIYYNNKSILNKPHCTSNSPHWQKQSSIIRYSFIYIKSGAQNESLKFIKFYSNISNLFRKICYYKYCSLQSTTANRSR